AEKSLLELSLASVTATVLEGEVQTVPGISQGTAKTASVDITGVLSATGVKAQSTTTCKGSVGSTTIASLTIGKMTLLNLKPKPNQTIVLGVVKIVLNEQTPIPGGLAV